jgi:dephospho-CoA kinase
MLIVALTGGIGSGKSMVGDMFADLGAVVVDSDQLAREVVERGSDGFDQVLAAFGDGVLKNGDLDRASLAELIFNDANKRVQLEQITHPLIRKAFTKVIEAADANSIVINQIPLLVESKNNYQFDYTITVTAGEDTRSERLRKKGFSSQQIQQRMQAQASDSEREAISDTVITNNKSESELRDQVEKIWEILQIKNKAK